MEIGMKKMKKTSAERLKESQRSVSNVLESAITFPSKSEFHGVYPDVPITGKDKNICDGLAKMIKNELKALADGRRIWTFVVVTGNGHDWEDAFMGADGEEFLNWGMLITCTNREMNFQVEIIHRGNSVFLVHGLDDELIEVGATNNDKVLPKTVFDATMRAATTMIHSMMNRGF